VVLCGANTCIGGVAVPERDWVAAPAAILGSVRLKGSLRKSFKTNQGQREYFILLVLY
jgi:hypothetical protein